MSDPSSTLREAINRFLVLASGREELKTMLAGELRLLQQHVAERAEPPDDQLFTIASIAVALLLKRP